MGFLGKFYVLAAGAAAAAWPLIIILVVTSVAGLFYYLRIVVALYSAPPERAPIQMASRGGAFILVGTHDSADLVWSLSRAVAQPDPNNHGRSQCCCLVATQPGENSGWQLGCLIPFCRHSTPRSDDDGTMGRVPDLVRFCAVPKLKRRSLRNARRTSPERRAQRQSRRRLDSGYGRESA